MVLMAVSVDPKCVAFHSSVPLPISCNPRLPLDPIVKPKACIEETRTPPAGKTKRVSSPTKSMSRSPSPRKSDGGGLLYRPEAVLSLLAFGFMASVAYVTNTGRRIAADISLRSKRIAQDKLQVRRYKARLLEEEFLESAIEATAATLNNTEDFLSKQLKRAEQAEERLRELQVSTAEVDAVARRSKELKTELKRKEAELEDNCQSTEENETLLSELRLDVSKRRESLADFERELKDARHALEKAERHTSGTLQSAMVEKERLELILKQKEAQLAEELIARDLHMKRIGKEEDRLQRTGVAVDRTLSDIETRRKKIDSVAKEAATAGKIASQEKLALETTIVQEIRPDDIEDSLRRIGEKQKLLRERIHNSLRSEAQQAALCTNLRKEIQARDEALQEQRAQLSTIGNGTQSITPLRSKPVDAPREKESQQSDASHKEANGTNLYDISESEVIDGNIHSTPVHVRKPTKVPVPLGTKSEGDAAPGKRRRGRPRKTDIERSQELVKQSPKRSRGRPRKKPIDDDVSEETSPRKKRGRPRKTSATAKRNMTAKESSS